MFERFSESAIKAIMVAQDESRKMGHNFVGTEQLLLGCLSAKNNVTQLLEATGVSLEVARDEVQKIIGTGSGFVAVDIPWTPNAKLALEAANDQACEERTAVKAEHILLASINLPLGTALRVLENLGVDIEQLKQRVLAQIQEKLHDTASTSSTKKTTRIMMTVTVLLQESGSWVAQTRTSGVSPDHLGFTSIANGNTDFLAIAEALEALTQMYRNFKGGSTSA